jgi:hypothetical protein
MNAHQGHLKHKYLVIDNRSRDTLLDGLSFKQLDGNAGPFDYTVSLSELSTGMISNVHSMRVKLVTMARPQTEDWVAVDIEPGVGHIMTLDGETSGASFVVAFENYSSYMTTVCLKADHLFGALTEFSPPLGRLDKLHVRFRRFGGATLSQNDFWTANNVLIQDWDRHTLFLDVTYSTI